jgi:hypothetical protein
MNGQPTPKKAARATQPGFLETVKAKIGSGMGYIDSVLSHGPQMAPQSGRILPSSGMIRPQVKDTVKLRKP